VTLVADQDVAIVWFLDVKFGAPLAPLKVADAGNLMMRLDRLLEAGIWAERRGVWDNFGALVSKNRKAAVMSELEAQAARARRETTVVRVSYASPWYAVLAAPGAVAGAVGLGLTSFRGALRLFKAYDDVRLHHGVTNIKMEVLRRLHDHLPLNGTTVDDSPSTDAGVVPLSEILMTLEMIESLELRAGDTS